MVIIYTRAKNQGQRSLGSKDRVETDDQTGRQTELIALPYPLMQSVTINEIAATQQHSRFTSFFPEQPG